MGMRRWEDTERAVLVYASWKSGQRGRTLLSSRTGVTTALLPPDAAQRSTCLSSRESASLGNQVGKKCLDPLTLVGEFSVRQRQARFSEVLGVIFLPHEFAADASGSYECLVGACADARTHSGQGTGTAVREGCLRCCALGSLAPR
jgi:hypothetical protein